MSNCIGEIEGYNSGFMVDITDKVCLDLIDKNEPFKMKLFGDIDQIEYNITHKSRYIGGDEDDDDEAYSDVVVAQPKHLNAKERREQERQKQIVDCAVTIRSCFSDYDDEDVKGFYKKVKKSIATYRKETFIKITPDEHNYYSLLKEYPLTIINKALPICIKEMEDVFKWMNAPEPVPDAPSIITDENVDISNEIIE